MLNNRKYQIKTLACSCLHISNKTTLCIIHHSINQYCQEWIIELQWNVQYEKMLWHNLRLLHVSALNTGMPQWLQKPDLMAVSLLVFSITISYYIHLLKCSTLMLYHLWCWALIWFCCRCAILIILTCNAAFDNIPFRRDIFQSPMEFICLTPAHFHTPELFSLLPLRVFIFALTEKLELSSWQLTVIYSKGSLCVTTDCITALDCIRLSSTLDLLTPPSFYLLT